MFSQGDKTQETGFTLIEVCIVLITIGVLTGVVITERNVRVNTDITSSFKNRVESCVLAAYTYIDNSPLKLTGGKHGKIQSLLREFCHVESGIKTTAFKDPGTNQLEIWKIKKKQEFWKKFKKEENEKWRDEWNEKWRDEWNGLKKSDEWLALLLKMNEFKMSTRELK